MSQANYQSTLQVHCDRSQVGELRQLLSTSPQGKSVKDFARKFDAGIVSIMAGHSSPQKLKSRSSWRRHHWGCTEFDEITAFDVSRDETAIDPAVSAVVTLQLVTSGGFPHRWVTDLSALVPTALLGLTFRSREDESAGYWRFSDGKFIDGWMDDAWDGSDFDAQEKLTEPKGSTPEETIRQLARQWVSLNQD